MPELIAKIFDWIKSPRQCAPVFLATLVFLLLPVQFLQKNGLELLVRYRGWAIVAAILSGAVLVTESAYHFWQVMAEKRDSKALRETQIGCLRSLSPGEKGLLLRYIAQQTETQYLHTTDGTVGSLVAKGLLYRASSVGQHSTRGPIFAYNLQTWVREYIEAHSEVLDGAQQPALPPSPFNL